MSDNITKSSWDAGDTIAFDDVGGVKYPIGKLAFGALDTATLVSTTAPLPIDYTKSASVIDLTTTPLGIGASYTSQTFDHSTGGAYVAHYVYSDVGGTHYAEDSHDGTNWFAFDTEPVTGTVPLREAHQSIARYSRARYVNGGTAQGVFYHQAIQRHMGQDEYVKISDVQNVVKGNKSNDTAAPTSDNFSTLTAIALASDQTWTEGREQKLRVTLAGDLATTLNNESVNVRALIATTDEVAAVGNVAHDGADTGNPVKIGGKAQTSNPSAVAAGDRVDAYFDIMGRQLVKLNAPRELIVKNTITLSTTAETTLLAAGAAGVFHDLTMIEITNSSATAVVVSLRDATAGSVEKNYAIAANGGGVFSYPTPATQTTAANNWTAQLSAGVSSVYVNVQGVKT